MTHVGSGQEWNIIQSTIPATQAYPAPAMHLIPLLGGLLAPEVGQRMLQRPDIKTCENVLGRGASSGPPAEPSRSSEPV